MRTLAEWHTECAAHGLTITALDWSDAGHPTTCVWVEPDGEAFVIYGDGGDGYILNTAVWVGDFKTPDGGPRVRRLLDIPPLLSTAAVVREVLRTTKAIRSKRLLDRPKVATSSTDVTA